MRPETLKPIGSISAISRREPLYPAYEEKPMSKKTTKAELLRQVTDLEGQLRDAEALWDVAKADREAAIKERDTLRAEVGGLKEVLEGTRIETQKAKTEAQASDFSFKALKKQQKRESLLAKVVRKERDFYRSIIEAIAWELKQEGSVTKNPWSASWLPIIGGAALGPALWLMLKSARKGKKVAEKTVAEKTVTKSDTSSAWSKVFSGAYPGAKAAEAGGAASSVAEATTGYATAGLGAKTP